jgi:PAS domain S-box-containing protein
MASLDTDAVNRRLAALAATGLLDSPKERRFDRLTRVVAAALRVPVSAVALVDAERQFFKSAVGLGAPWDERRETPLSHSFCRHVVETEAPLVVEDSRTNALVADNPAIDELGVAAYLGIPIADKHGVVIGSLCAIDHMPRAWDNSDLDILADVAALVEREIAERRASDALAEAERTWRGILNTMPHMVFATGPDGAVLGFNDQWHDFTGTLAGDAVQQGWSDFCHAEDRAAAQSAWAAALESGEVFEQEFRLLHKDGAYRWVLARAVPLREEDGAVSHWFGSCTDIEALKQLQKSNDFMKRELAGNLISRLSDQAAYAKGEEFEEIRGLIRALRDVN